MENSEGIDVLSNFNCRPIEDLESLNVDDSLKKALNGITSKLPPALMYGLPVIAKVESLYLTSPSGTLTSVLSMIGLIQFINPSIKSLQAIVVFPKKTLIDEYIKKLINFNTEKKITWLKCVGGEFFNKKLLPKANLLICTPGKLLSFLENSSLNFQNLKIVTFSVCSNLFLGDIKPQSEKILEKLPNDLIYWFFSPIPDEISKQAFLLKDPDGKTIEITDNRALKDVSFHCKLYESDSNIFEYLGQRIEQFEGQVIIFTSDSEEIERTCKALERFNVLKLVASDKLDEQFRIKDLFCDGSFKVLVCQGNFALVRKVMCRGIVEVYCLDNVNAGMLVARARRGSFIKGDKLVLFYKEYEKDDILALGHEVGVEILCID